MTDYQLPPSAERQLEGWLAKVKRQENSFLNRTIINKLTLHQQIKWNSFLRRIRVRPCWWLQKKNDWMFEEFGVVPPRLSPNKRDRRRY